jgi:hypothetical protein
LASEDVLEVRVRRHVFTSERPFTEIMDGIYGGISQPDIGTLFRELAASTSYEQFSSLVRQAQGSAGLMRFLELKLDSALALDPQARSSAGRGLVRLIAGNPVTMGEMTRHVPDAGSYAPVTILIEQLPGGGTRIAYDSVVSELAIYDDPAATKVAEHLDAEVLGLLREACGLAPDQSLPGTGRPLSTRTAQPFPRQPRQSGSRVGRCPGAPGRRRDARLGARCHRSGREAAGQPRGIPLSVLRSVTVKPESGRRERLAGPQNSINAGRGGFPHKNPTDETALCGTRRHGC